MFEIKKMVRIGAPIDRVFTALTSSDEIIKYYPLKEVQSTWKLGADVLIKGEVDGAPFIDYGVIEEIQSPTVYSYRYWSDNHGTERTPENHMLISYVLSECSGDTELTVTQSRIQSEEMCQLMDTQVWDYLLGSLKKYVEACV